MGDRAGSSPVARTNKKDRPKAGLSCWCKVQDENRSKCNTPVAHRWRGLDRATP